MAPILSKLVFNTTAEFEEITHDPKDIYAIATIIAPDIEIERAPIDITCVIDRSGSMGGSKIKLVKETLSFVVDQLSDADKLSLVVFDHVIEKVLNPSNMTKSNKVEAKNIIAGITARGSTNLSDALYTGLNVCAERINPNDICSVLLFTDGLANAGIVAADQIVAGMDAPLKKMSKPANVFTFGFGADHDANMLRAVSEAGNGLYYYISKNEEIPQSFSDCLGGLLSVCAQNIKLKVDVVEGCTLINIHTDYKKLNQNEVLIGDLYSGESKDIVFQVHVDATGEDNISQELVNLSLTYDNVIDKTQESHTSKTIVRRLQDARMDRPNKDVDKQRVRISQADALRQARIFADQGNLVGARNAIQQQQQVIKSSAYAGEDGYYDVMNMAMDQVMETTSSLGEYQSRGNKVMNKQWSEQVNQRSNDAESMFLTRKKKSMFSNFLKK